MGNLILFASTTVDGFMAGPDNDLGFMVPDDQLDETITGELVPRGDTIVVGRKSFQVMAAYWPTATGPLAQWMNDTPKVVLSNTAPDTSTWQNSTVATGDGAAEVERLKRLPGGALVVPVSPPGDACPAAVCWPGCLDRAACPPAR